MNAAIKATVLAIAAATMASGAVAAADEPKCTSESADSGSFFLGVPADRPNFLGDRVATDTLHDWIPRDPYKQVVCGRLDHVGFFHNVTAEFDWDLYISPSPRYQLFAADDAAEPCVHSREREGAPEQAGLEPPKCLSAEVTAPPRLRNANPWWNWSRQTSTLIDRQFCVYGPWVSDNAHGSRPEIHPVNALWWSNQDPQQENGDPRPLVRNLIILQDASGRFQRGEAFRAPEAATMKQARAKLGSWITTAEDFCIGFGKPGATTQRYRVQTTGDSVKSFDVDVGPNGAVAPKKCDQATRGKSRPDPVDLCSENGILHLSVRWGPPRCDYCGEEKFLAVRILPAETGTPAPAAPTPASPSPPVPPASSANSTVLPAAAGCEPVLSNLTDRQEHDPDSIPLPISLQPPPRADATWLEEKPTRGAAPAASAAWTELSRCLGQESPLPDAARWAQQLVGIGTSDLTVAREYEGSVQDWSVVWDTSTLRQMALKPGMKDRLVHEHMQTESVRVYLHEGTAFEAHRVRATVVMPNWGARQNYVARNVANVGLAANSKEVVELLDRLVPLNESGCGAATWSAYQQPTDFRPRYIRGLVESEARKSVEAQPAAPVAPEEKRRLFTLASLQRIVYAARNEKSLICPAPLP